MKLLPPAIPSRLLYIRRQRKVGRAYPALILFLASALTASAVAPLPPNLGGGLAAVVRRELAKAAGQPFDAPGTGAAVDLGDDAFRDEQGRFMVTVLLRQQSYRDSVLASGLLRLTAEDMSYQGGILEGYVAVTDVAALATRDGVTAVHLVVKPVLDVGATTSQGVVQHRVDQFTNQAASPVTGITGSRIRVGVISDSFNTSVTDATGGVTMTRAEEDVATGDLPGPGNPNNPEPVLVLEDYRAAPPASSIDEGRAMCQIVHDMAPRAQLAFATAFTGEVGFANNIRRLAAPRTNNPATSGAGCHVIVDDIIYQNEGMFQDTIIARAADDVFAQGVPYFSSAGNRPATQGYFSDFRPVANGTGVTATAGNTALANTNINLTGVPAELYAGGFHNFNPAPGQLDVAQTVAIGTSATFSFQWDDPYDVNPVTVDPPFLKGDGTVAPAGSFEFTFAGNAKQRVQITVVGRGTSPNFDAIVELIDPDGVSLLKQDTGTSETVTTFLPKTGTYKVRVTEFAAAPPVPPLGGEFHYEVANASGVPFISSDFNVLFFKEDGSFINQASENNINTNRPVELARVTNSQAGNTGRVQVVFARSNVPPAGTPQATKVRYVTFTSGFPQEYFGYQTPVTFGHNSAAGANGVAAYAFYPPYIPEGFTSPGFTYIAFDKKNNRLPDPEIRQKPDMAAMDGANTTFFPGAQGDSAQDADNFPNFFGTSAAAPHAAAIAALVLEARGGPGSVTPLQMRGILQRSAFPHDLDPYFARGVALAGASRVTITADSDQGSAANFTSTIDRNVFKVSFDGTDALTKIVFNPEGTNATGGNTTQMTRSSAVGTSNPGLVFDRRPPNTGFPFTLGELRGVAATDISHALSNPAPPPAESANQFFTLTVDIAANALGAGEGFNFGIDRDEADAIGPVNPPDPRLGGAVGGNAADLLGANVLIPEGGLAPGGMTIGGTLASGATFSGIFVNNVGAGYSTLDGYGFINAQAAITQPVTPDPTPVPTATPTPAAVAQNLSTRLLVQRADEQGIAGFIITGASPKRIIVRALGPSLAQSGVTNPLADPVVQLHGSEGQPIVANDNWRDTQEAEIKATGIPPTEDAEAAIVLTLAPGSYTAVVGGKDETSGVGLIEVYDLDDAGASRLGNISTRGSVQTGTNVAIGGFILGRNSGNANIILRGIGPSLAKFGISNPLPDPTLQLRDGNGGLISTNNDWQDDAEQAAQISGSGVAPEDARESAIAAGLPPGHYTVVLAGRNNGTGIGLVEVFTRD